MDRKQGLFWAMPFIKQYLFASWTAYQEIEAKQTHTHTQKKFHDRCIQSIGQMAISWSRILVGYRSFSPLFDWLQEKMIDWPLVD